MPNPRTIPTATALRSLAYHAIPGWHGHGASLVPNESCHACIELRRRQAEDAKEPPHQPEGQ